MNTIDSYKIPDLGKFNKSPKKASFQILENLMLFLIFYPVMLSILGILHKNSFIFIHEIALIAYVILINLIRIKVSKHAVAISLTLVLSCIFILIPFPYYERFLYCIYAVLALINSIRKFYKINFTFYSASFFVLGEVLLSLNLVGSYALKNLTSRYLTLFYAVILSLVFLFYSSRSKYELLINSETGTNSNRPISLSSKKMLISMLFAFLVFMCFTLSITSPISSIGDQALVNSLANIFSTNNTPGLNQESNENIFKKLQNPYMNKSNKQAQENSTYRNNSFLNKYVYLILFLILAFIISLIMSKIIKFLVNAKIENQQDATTETTFLNEDFKKDISNIVPKFNFNLSNKEKLRKHYKKLIKHYNKKGLVIKDSLTAKELENKILNLTGDDIKNITKIYDKARYSLYEPTKNDIDNFKK